MRLIVFHGKTAKIQRNGDVCCSCYLIQLPYSEPLEFMRMRLILLQEMHVSFDSPVELAVFLDVIRAHKP